MGLPGCVMYAKATIFDLVLPRIAAGVRLTSAILLRSEKAVCVSAVRSALTRTAASEVCDMLTAKVHHGQRPVVPR